MAGKVLNLKVCSPLKLCSGLTGNYHAICHYSYNSPLAQIMKNCILKILILLFCVTSYSQEKQVEYPDFTGKTLSEIENNTKWIVLQKVSGDLNKDKLKDFVLVVESKDSVFEKRCSQCYILKNKARIIIVALKQKEKNKIVIQNNEFIARGDEGGMANYIEPELSIKNGNLRIFYQFTRSNQSYTFAYKNNRMEIIKAENNSVNSTNGKFISNKFDFEKGTIITETSHISESKSKTEKTNISLKSKSLSEFKEMYDWEVIENKYL
jgi:hypothetical protein